MLKTLPQRLRAAWAAFVRDPNKAGTVTIKVDASGVISAIRRERDLLVTIGDRERFRP